LITLDEELGLFLPDYDKSIVNIPNSLLKLLGMRPVGDPLPDEIFANLEGIGSFILFIADGLSASLLESADKFQLLLRKSSYYGRISSVFPSTTTTAISSLVTGLEPAEHGVLGYSMLCKEAGGIVELVRSNDMNRVSLEPRDILPNPPIYKLAAEEGLNPKLFIKKHLKGTFLTHVMYEGADVEPYIGLEDLMLRFRRLDDFNMVSAYWEDLDTVGHAYSPDSHEMKVHLNRLVKALLTLPLEKEGKHALILTADHGFVDITRHQEVLAEDKELMDLLYLPPFGDVRSVFLIPTEEAEEVVVEKLEKISSNWALVMKKEEIISKGLLGKKDPGRLALSRLGRLVLLPMEGYAYDIRMKDRKRYMKGGHSGLSKRELEVPFMVLRFS
jgi:predicted AlkP superfamily pyrophosphatase or phosphodiesterase